RPAALAQAQPEHEQDHDHRDDRTDGRGVAADVLGDRADLALQFAELALDVVTGDPFGGHPTFLSISTRPLAGSSGRTPGTVPAIPMASSTRATPYTAQSCVWNQSPMSGSVCVWSSRMVPRATRNQPSANSSEPARPKPRRRPRLRSGSTVSWR